MLGKIPAVPDADGIIYDKKLNRVLAVSGDGNELLTFSPDIDPTAGKLDPPIPLGGAPEFLASDGSGKVYINLEDKNMVAVVDLQTRKVVDRWPVAPGGHPVGMAMDPATHRLLSAAAIRNASGDERRDRYGRRVRCRSAPVSMPRRFDAGQAFASAGDGTLTVTSVKGGKWVVDQTVTTPMGARTMGLDPATHRIYLPTAELEPAGYR